jgi:uncharacterized OsmC-like protein/ketosteroid isomerase-like protein
VAFEVSFTVKMRASLLRGGKRAVMAMCSDNSSSSAHTGELIDEENPLEILVSAIGGCYAATLGLILDRWQLPWALLEIEVDAAVSVDRGAPRLDAVVIHPVVSGGDPGIRGRYHDAVSLARDESVTGRAIRGNVAIKIGSVAVVTPDSAGTAARKPRTPSPGAEGEIIERHLSGFDLHQSTEVLATLHRECELVDMALSRTFKGATAVVAYYRNWWRAFDLSAFDNRVCCREPNAVVVEARCTGVHKRASGGVTPAHRPIQLPVIAVAHFRGGLIGGLRLYYDTATLRGQLVTISRGVKSGDRPHARNLNEEN